MDEGGPKEKVERVENTPDAFPLEKKGGQFFIFVEDGGRKR